MPSHRLQKIKLDDLDIIGYSIAGEETVVAMPQLDVCFDIGKAPDQVISVNNCLLTHGHMDHAAGLAYYLSHRNFSGQAPGTVLAPENLIKPIEKILQAWGRLDGNPIPANLIGVKPGDEYRIKPNLFARVVPTSHSRGSVGYSVIESRKKLRPEFKNLKGPEIVDKKKQGVEVEYNLEIPIVTYLGDTSYADFSKYPCVADSRILIVECTFFIPEHIERAKAGRHIHIDNLINILDELNNPHVVLIHTSQRIGFGQIRRILCEKLSDDQLEKVTLLMERPPTSK